MSKLRHRLMGGACRNCMAAVLLALMVGAGGTSAANADEANAKQLLKAMSDYLAAQRALSFNYDAALEVITKDDQRLALLSSGAITLNRPDKIRTARSGGFADIEILFDGKTLTLFGKNANAYSQVDIPGSIDHLVDELREKYSRPLPAADLLLTKAYDELMLDVVDIKDLGSGVVGGVECDFLAFRKKEVDFQIWIAQGSQPYPCRYTVTSSNGLQYSIQVRDWKTGNEVASADFSFKNATNASKIDPKDIRDKIGDLPAHFTMAGGGR